MQYKTKRLLINKSFLEELFNIFGFAEFTNADAYKLYVPRVRDPYYVYKGTLVEGSFAQMNVRRILGLAAIAGLLTRLKPGHYKFVMSPEKFSE